MLRQFSGLWLAFFGGWAVWQWLVRDRPAVALLLGALALVVGLLGLCWPGLIRPVFVGWMIAAFPIGWVVSKVLAAALFYTVFTPMALIFRLIGRDALMLRRDPGRTTYWNTKSSPTDPRRYLREF
jgi:hypothetical protein